MDLTGTILNSKVTEAQTDQFARLYLWDANNYTQEKVKAEEKLTKEAEFFIRFFHPIESTMTFIKTKLYGKYFLMSMVSTMKEKLKKINY